MRTTKSWCDMACVTEAITKHTWWWRAWSLVALQIGPEQVRRFTRGCHCHRRLFDLDGDLRSYWKSRDAYFRETKQRKVCPGKGLCAPEFALGKAMEIMKEGFASGRSMLTSELDSVSEDDCSEIVSDYDKSHGSIVQMAELKLGRGKCFRSGLFMTRGFRLPQLRLPWSTGPLLTQAGNSVCGKPFRCCCGWG